MKQIPLSRTGCVALIDDEDAALLAGYRWFLASHGRKKEKSYARATIYLRLNGKRVARTVYMHRLILGISDPSVRGDHINGNTLDNRRTNLRCATASQNAQNRRKRTDTLVPYKGVQFRAKFPGRYKAKIKLPTGHKYLGTFNSVLDAALAYDRAAIEHFGEFASLNFAPAGQAVPEASQTEITFLKEE